MDSMKLPSDDLTQYKRWFRADRDHSSKWRRNAKEDFQFLAGEQYTPEEKADLKEQLRPEIVFNRTHSVINAVSGLEVSNRQEVKYFPREQGDAAPDEILTEGAEWFRDQAEADDEDSDAFLDAAVCGMGWTETTMDYDEEEDGAPAMSSVNPLEMYWDRNARKKNLRDANRIWRVRDIPISQALEMFPDAKPEDLDARWAAPDYDDTEEDETQEQANLYNGESTEELARDDRQVTIVHLQYKKRVPVFIVADPTTGEKTKLSAAEHAKLKARMDELGIPLVSSRGTDLQVQNCFIGGKVLQDGPALCKTHFSFNCVTAYLDRTTGLFYGLMKLMKDPQRWANKWMLQALHILNSNAKGGLMYEEGAIENVRQFEKDWAKPNKAVKVAAGAIANSRIKEKPQPQMPASFYQMMSFAIEAVREVPGVSLELLGQRESDQPASLEYQRRQAGQTILAPLFDNLKRYRRDHGKLMLYIIQKYLADGRLVRVVGKEGAKYVPLALRQDVRYDIIVDDQPNSPDHKMLVWQMAMQIWKMIPPEVQLELLDYSPLPTSVVQKIKDAVARIQPNQQPDPNVLKAQNDAQYNQGKLQIEAGKSDLEWKRALLDAMTRINVAQIGAKTDTDSAAIDAELQAQLGLAGLANDQQMQMSDQAHQAGLQMLNNAHERRMQQEAPAPAARAA